MSRSLFLVLQNDGTVKEYCESKAHIPLNTFQKRNLDWMIYQFKNPNLVHLGQTGSSSKPSSLNAGMPNNQASIFGIPSTPNVFPPNVEDSSILGRDPSQNVYPANVEDSRNSNTTPSQNIQTNVSPSQPMNDSEEETISDDNFPPPSVTDIFDFDPFSNNFDIDMFEPF